MNNKESYSEPIERRETKAREASEFKVDKVYFRKESDEDNDFTIKVIIETV